MRPVAIPSYLYFMWALIEILPCVCLLVFGVGKDKSRIRFKKNEWFIMNWSHQSTYKSPYLTLLNSMWICGSQSVQKQKKIQKFFIFFLCFFGSSYLICMGIPTTSLYLTTSWPIYILNEYLSSINLYHLKLPL